MVTDLDKNSVINSNRKPANLFDGWSLEGRDPAVIESLLPLGEWLYRNYFKVTTDGWHHLPADGSMLIVGSHNGGLLAPDTLMFMVDWFRKFGAHRPVYGLMHPNVWMLPIYSHLTVKLGAVMAHPKMASAALQQGAAVLVYPGGAQDLWRLHKERDRIHFVGRKGFIKLALREKVPIIPAISHGAHDTLIVLADFYKELRQLHDWGMPWPFGFDPMVFPIYLGLPWGLAIGPLPNIPLPVPIHTRICPPIEFDRYGREAALDRDYVDACYEKVCTLMQRELDTLVAEQSTTRKQ